MAYESRKSLLPYAVGILGISALCFLSLPFIAYMDLKAHRRQIEENDPSSARFLNYTSSPQGIKGLEALTNSVTTSNLSQ